MSRLRKCDRCGKLYDYDDEWSYRPVFKGEKRHSDHTSRIARIIFSSPYLQVPKDLCGECAHELVEWFNSKAVVKGVN